MTKNEQELIDAKKRLSATKYILPLALGAGPLGLLVSPLCGFITLGVLLSLWGVTTYISYMHYITLKNRRDAEF